MTMGAHAHHRRAPQGLGGGFPTLTNIGAPAVTADPSAPIQTASQGTPLTTITNLIELITTGADGKPTPITSTAQVVVTDSASYSALVSSESAARQSASPTSSATPSATSSVAASSDDSNLSTLIPAIVVPIVVVLLASLGAFWFFMRRRSRKQAKKAQFIMAGKAEEMSSRSNSGRTGTSGTTAAEKSMAASTTKEILPPKPFTADSSRTSFDEIGIARPMTPKDYTKGRTGPASPARPYQNFSGPRPNTARQAPPSRSGEPRGNRSRSNSSPGKRERGPPPTSFKPRPIQPHGTQSPNLNFGPSPIIRDSPSSQPGVGVAIGSGLAAGFLPAPHTSPRPAPPPPGRLRDGSPSMGMNRGNAPLQVRAPPPGAFNGSSPISQYSPIIKDTPNLGAVATFGASPQSSPPRNKKSTESSRIPPPITTTNLGHGLGLSKSPPRAQSPMSPAADNFLTEENMRIARLANSSRLGFNTTNDSPANEQKPNTNFNKPLNFNKPGYNSPTQQPLLPLGGGAYSQDARSPATASNPSPKLPPPATRSQLYPADSPRDERKPGGWHYYGGNTKPSSPTSAAPSVKAQDPPSNHDSFQTAKAGDDERNSMISDIDAYEDIDAKSDVSSLNEFERFEFDSIQGSQSGSARATPTHPYRL